MVYQSVKKSLEEAFVPGVESVREHKSEQGEKTFETRRREE
jgi:hypothetical protein